MTTVKALNSQLKLNTTQTYPNQQHKSPNLSVKALQKTTVKAPSHQLAPRPHSALTFRVLNVAFNNGDLGTFADQAGHTILSWTKCQ